jgi:hypothetical protein
MSKTNLGNNQYLETNESPDGNNWNFDSIVYEYEIFIWVYGLDCKESLHRIKNMNNKT